MVIYGNSFIATEFQEESKIYKLYRLLSSIYTVMRKDSETSKFINVMSKIQDK
jgi:hypothetical protein